MGDRPASCSPPIQGLTALLTTEPCPLPPAPPPGLGPRETPTCSPSPPSTELHAVGASAPGLVATVSRKEYYDPCVACEQTEAWRDKTKGHTDRKKWGMVLNPGAQTPHHPLLPPARMPPRSEAATPACHTLRPCPSLTRLPSFIHHSGSSPTPCSAWGSSAEGHTHFSPDLTVKRVTDKQRRVWSVPWQREARGAWPIRRGSREMSRLARGLNDEQEQLDNESQGDALAKSKAGAETSA